MKVNLATRCDWGHGCAFKAYDVTYYARVRPVETRTLCTFHHGLMVKLCDWRPVPEGK